MANIILDNVTINQPVADAAARNAIPTGSLNTGDLVFTVSENQLYTWSGSAWIAATVSLAQIWNTIYTATTSGAYVGTDVIPVVRSVTGTPTIFKLTQANLVAAMATVIAASPDGSAPDGTDLFPILRSGAWSTLSWNEILAAIPAAGSFDPFDAKCATGSAVSTAITAGNTWINIIGTGITLPALTLTKNTLLFLSPGATITSSAGITLSANVTLTISGSGQSNIVAWGNSNTPLATGPASSTFAYNNITLTNMSTSDNISVSTGCKEVSKDAFIKSAINVGSGINLTVPGSYCINPTLQVPTSGSGDILIVNLGCYASQVTLDSSLATVGTRLINIAQGATCNGINCISGVAANTVRLSAAGVISNLTTDATTTVDVTLNGGSLYNAVDCFAINVGLNGTNASVYNSDINGAIIFSSATNPRIFGSNGSGTFVITGATGYMGVGNTGVITNTGTSGSYDPFTAKATTAAELATALAGSKAVINIDGNITLTADLTQLTNTYLFFSPGAQLNMGVYTWDRHGAELVMQGADFVYVRYAATVANVSAFINTAGVNAGLSCSSIQFFNIGDQPNTPIFDSNTYGTFDNCSIVDNGEVNSGLNLQRSGSSVTQCSFSTGGSGGSEDTLVIVDGSYAQDIWFDNIRGSSHSLITIHSKGQLKGLFTENGGILITNNGSVSQINPPVDGTSYVSVTCDANSSVSNCTVATTVISGNAVRFENSVVVGNFTINSGVTQTHIIGSEGSGGTYTDNGTATVASGNSGYFPNGGAGANALSPFQAALDGVGSLANHFINAGAAYTAGQSELYTVANITETANIPLTNTQQLFIQVGQNFAEDLSTFQIVGSLANAITIELTDASSMFRYSTAGTPFTSFDVNSTINIIARGGVVQNRSTTANSYITGLGTILIDGPYFLLPNASAGGIKTNTYTSLSNAEFIGGGSACDTAILAGGGSVCDIILSGNNWASDAVIMDTTGNTTLYDNIYVDINQAVTLILQGQASRISRNLDPLYTAAIMSVVLGSNSELTGSYADVLTLLTDTTGVKVFGGNCATISLSPDNTTQADWVGVTFTQAVSVYGTHEFTGCHFLGGITVNTGASAVLIGCDSVNALVNNGAVRRSGNDTNIGNDYGGSTATISEWDAEVDGSGSEASHYATFNAAVAANTSEILMTADTSLTADVVFTKPVRLKLLGHKLTLNGFTINCKTYDFVIEGVNSDNSGIVVSATNITESIFSDSDPDSPTAKLIFRDSYVDMSAVTTPNCALGTTLLLSTNQGTKLIAANVDSSGFLYDLQHFNGFGSDLRVEVPAGFSSCTRAVILASLSVVNTLDIYTQDTSASQVLVSVTDSSVLHQISYASANISGMTIENDNIINETQIFSSSVTTLNITVTSDGAIVRNTDLGAGGVNCGNKNGVVLDNVLGTISNNGGNNTQMVNCTTTGTVTIGGNHQQLSNCNFATLTNTGNNTSISNCFATTWGTETGTGRASATCQGAIPNSYSAGSTGNIDIFDAEVDGTGLLPDHYITLNAAFTAGKNKILVSASCVLTANITLVTNTYIQFINGAQLDTNGFQIFQENFHFRLAGMFNTTTGIVCPSSTTLPPIAVTGSDDAPLFLEDILLDLSAVTAAGCAIGVNSCVYGRNVILRAGNAAGAGILLQPAIGFDTNNPYIDSLTIYLPTTNTDLTHALELFDGAVVNKCSVYLNHYSPSGVLMTIDKSSRINNLTFTQGNPTDGFTIEHAGVLSNANCTNDSIPILNITVTEDGAVVEKCKLGTGVIDCNGKNYAVLDTVSGGISNNTGTNTRMVNCNFTGTATIGGNNQQLSNSNFSTLNNAGNDTSISNCYATTWGTETGTGRKSATCQGAIPNS